MSKISHFMASLDLSEGFSNSRLEGVRFFKHFQSIPRTPLLYDPGLCIVIQGHKIGYLGEKRFQYDANNYLVVPVFIQFECETFATEDNPLLGIYIDIDMAQLNDLIASINSQVDQTGIGNDRLPLAMAPAKLDEDMADAILRLLKVLMSETETRILGSACVREIIFRALLGNQAPILHALALHNGYFSRIARALKLIQKDYMKKLGIEQLASEAYMSISTFHRVFKEITAQSPMQYLKKVRLTKARDLILYNNLRVYSAAEQVGYESVSQFSREFKRYFGKNPGTFLQ